MEDTIKYKIYIDNKCYKIDTNELPLIGEGVEGKVYLFQHQALKLYKQNRDKYFITPTTEKIEYLSKIKLEHFPFATHPVLNKEKQLIGHINPLITNEKPIKELRETPIKELIIELKEIRNEVNLLTKNYVLLSECDFYRNYIYNGKFNFIDHDMYKIYFNKMEFYHLEDKIEKENNFTINDFYIMNLILNKYKNKECLINKRKLVSKKIIEKFNLNHIYFENFLLEKKEKENIQTINELIKVYKKDILPK